MVEVESSEEPLNGVRVVEAKPFVVVGIPAYNEESSIAGVIVEAQKFADAVIVCDDGSKDLTVTIAERLGADVVRHKHNQGYGAAVESLFEKARELGADVLVTLDADGQHDPSEIPNVVKPIVQGTADLVIGSRFVDDGGKADMPFYRRLGAKLITKIVNGSSKNGVSDAQSGFRAYNRQAIDCLNVSEVGMGASVEILLEASKHNLRVCEVPSTCKYRTGDVATSSENPVTHGVGVLLSFVRLVVDEKPLEVLGVPGLLCLFAGIGFGLWMLQIYAAEHAIPTNVALASIALVLISFFMLSSAITLYAISRLARKVNSRY